MQKMSLPDLKERTKEQQAEVDENQRQINEEITVASNPKAAANLNKRFEDKFGFRRQRKTIKLTIVLFALVFVILFFLLPGIVLNTNDNKLILSNISLRNITNVSVTNLGNNYGSVNLGAINSNQKTSIALPNGIYIVTADRQFPTFALISSTANNNNENANNQLLNDLKRRQNG